MKAKKRAAKRPLFSVIVVDDDPTLLAVAERTAQMQGIAVTTCGSLSELDVLAMPGVFDVAVVDYYLDGMAHSLQGAQIAKWFGTTPVVFMSSDGALLKSTAGWPQNVKAFVQKHEGMLRIFRKAAEHVCKR